MSHSDSDSNDTPSSWEPLVDDFDRLWQVALKGNSPRPRLNELLARVPTGAQAQLLELLAPIERECRLQLNESLQAESDYPELSAELRQQLGQLWATPLEAATLPPQKPGAAASVTTRTATSQTIGPYKLLQKLGEGGMGEVWMAEQSEPVRRRVALKLIKAGLDNKQVLARFEAERQALALMDHQNIARVLDAGATPEGAPYFVMELVQGIPFNQYCDQHKLSIDQRLELFLPVCAAVQHAHQKGIIHRDLKPSNVLVCLYDGKPVPKVIDFGLAKALQATTKLTDKTMFTEFGQVVGTLQYMSPEQAEMNQLDIDTRTDIYSLGVMLYELLTGSTPIDQETMRRQAILQVLEAIRVQEPPRPSARLSSATQEAASGISQQRQIEPSRLKSLLKGELDWIVMKSLEKDRTRRYETASSFGEDIQRFLSGDVVTARPPSLVYRVRKFARRNRVGVLAASLVLLALLAGIGGTTWGLFRALAAENLAGERLTEATAARDRESKQRLVAEQQREAAESARKDAEQAKAKAEAETAAKELALAEETRQREYAEAVTEFVERDFLELTSVEGQSDLSEDASVRELGKDTTLRELLDRAAEKLKQRENLAPEIEARLCGVVGNSYTANGDTERAIPFLERALKLCADNLGSDHIDTLTSISNLAHGFKAAGQLEKAIPLFENTLELRKARLGREHPQTLLSMSSLAEGYLAASKINEALSLSEQTLELMKAKFGPEHPDTLVSMVILARSYGEAGQMAKALPLLEQTLILMQAKLGPNHPNTLAVMNIVAARYHADGRLKEALQLFEQSLELIKAKLGADHPDTYIFMGNLAESYRAIGDFNRAVLLQEQTLEFRKANFGPAHPKTLTSMNNLAVGYDAAGQPEKAILLMEQTLALMNAKLAPDHTERLICMSNLGEGYRACGRLEKALPLLEQTLELMKGKLGPDHPNTVLCLNHLAGGYKDAGQLEKALGLYEQAVELSKAKLGPDHPNTLMFMNNLAFGYDDANRLDKAIPLYEQTAELIKAKLGPDHPRTLYCLNNLALSYASNGQLDKAVTIQEQILEQSKATFGPDHPDTLRSMNSLAYCNWQNGEFNKSIPMFEYVIKAFEEKLGRGHLDTQRAIGNLGANYSDSGRINEAIPLLEEAVSSSKQFPNLLWAKAFLKNAYLRAKQLKKFAAFAAQELSEAKTSFPSPSAELASVLVSLGNDFLTLGDNMQAEELLEEGFNIRKQVAPDLWNTFNAQSLLGGAKLAKALALESETEAEVKAKLLAEAEPLLVQGYEGMKQRESAIPSEAPDVLPEALDRLIALYDALAKPEEVAKYRELRSQYSIPEPSARKTGK